MNRWRLGFGVAGAVATGFGVALLLVPGAVAVGPVDGAVAALETAGTEQVLLAAGFGLVSYLAVALRTPAADPGADEPTRRFERIVERPPGTGPTGTNPIAAAELDEGIDAAIERGGEPLAVLRERLRTTAASVYAEATNAPEEAASAAVERGEWCRDSVAAAFLAGSGGPSHPPVDKLRLLLFPIRERRRRIERTMTAIERLEQ